MLDPADIPRITNQAKKLPSEAVADLADAAAQIANVARHYAQTNPDLKHLADATLTALHKYQNRRKR